MTRYERLALKFTGLAFLCPGVTVLLIDQFGRAGFSGDIYTGLQRVGIAFLGIGEYSLRRVHGAKRPIPFASLVAAVLYFLRLDSWGLLVAALAGAFYLIFCWFASEFFWTQKVLDHGQEGDGGGPGN